MVINKIKIGGFGKLENFSLDLKSGMQVVYGPNEFGKSTLGEFLKIMFYSRRGGEKSCPKDKALRQKYLPWSGTQMKGVLEFSHEGCTYRIQKDISSESAGKDKALVQNLSLGKIAELSKGEEIGEHFFGIDIKSFEKSSFVSNIGKVDFELSKNSKDSLADKIISKLSNSESDDVSKSVALKHIDDAMKELKAKRGNGGKIYDSLFKASEISSRIYDLKTFESAQQDLKSELCEVEKSLFKLEKLKDKIKKSENHNKFIKIKSVIECLKNIESYKKELETAGIDFSGISCALEDLKSQKEAAESCFSKMNEIKRIFETMRKSGEHISFKDMNALNLEMKRKEKIENSLKEINYILKLELQIHKNAFQILKDSEPEFCEDVFQNIDSYRALNANLENLKIRQKSIQEELSASELTLNCKCEELKSKEKSLKKKAFISAVLGCIGGGGFALLSRIFLGNSTGFALCVAVCFLCLCAGCVAAVFSLKKSAELKSCFEQTKKRREENHKNSGITLDDEILKISDKISELEKNLIFKIENKAKNLNSEFLKCSERTENMIKLKNCKTLEEYCSNYAKLENVGKIEESYKISQKDFENSKLSFVQSMTKYQKVSDFNDACKKLFQTEKICREIKSISEKARYQLSVLGLNNMNLKQLEAYAASPEFDLCESSINFEESEKIKSEIQILENLNLREKYIEIQKNIKEPEITLDELNKALVKEKSKAEIMKNYYRSLEIAASAIEESSDEIRKNFNPRLNKKASEIFCSLTGGKYSEMHVQKDYTLFINNSISDCSCDNFSSGTIDQAYLSLRIAISELISKENKIPIILDDVFMQYDETRLGNTLEFLKKYADNFPGERQIILFTCHRHIAEFANNKGIKVLI